jgi:hypothetical protein
MLARGAAQLALVWMPWRSASCLLTAPLSLEKVMHQGYHGGSSSLEWRVNVPVHVWTREGAAAGWNTTAHRYEWPYGDVQKESVHIWCTHELGLQGPGRASGDDDTFVMPRPGAPDATLPCYYFPLDRRQVRLESTAHGRSFTAQLVAVVLLFAAFAIAALSLVYRALWSPTDAEIDAYRYRALGEKEWWAEKEATLAALRAVAVERRAIASDTTPLTPTNAVGRRVFLPRSWALEQPGKVGERWRARIGKYDEEVATGSEGGGAEPGWDAVVTSVPSSLFRGAAAQRCTVSFMCVPLVHYDGRPAPAASWQDEEVNMEDLRAL